MLVPVLFKPFVSPSRSLQGEARSERGPAVEAPGAVIKLSSSGPRRLLRITQTVLGTIHTQAFALGLPLSSMRSSRWLSAKTRSSRARTSLAPSSPSPPCPVLTLGARMLEVCLDCVTWRLHLIDRWTHATSRSTTSTVPPHPSLPLFPLFHPSLPLHLFSLARSAAVWFAHVRFCRRRVGVLT